MAYLYSLKYNVIMGYSRIEEIVCSHFGMDVDEMRSRERKSRRKTDCLHFIWYMRHFYEGVSINGLAREYSKTPRNIYFAIAKIREGIITQKWYAEAFEKLRQKGASVADAPEGKE